MSLKTKGIKTINLRIDECHSGIEPTAKAGKHIAATRCTRLHNNSVRGE